MKKKTYIIPTLRVYRMDPVKLLDGSEGEQIRLGTGGEEGSTYDTF